MNEIMVPVKSLQSNPYQPRQHEDLAAVHELAENIERNATEEFDGLLQAPTVRQNSKGFQLAFGHTRRAAFEYLYKQGKDRYGSMRVIVRELSDVQMFEAAVAENIKRRDLNPIEQAESMRRYMDEFGKTSKEAGEFFNCSEENVRAKVRLLNLPEPVQAKMRAGEVNENTARSLLSMQKVASPEDVTRAVEKIEREKGRSMPEQIIENVIDRLDNVVELWDRDGKPHAGLHGWPLDMKKFPNDLLPAMSVEAVAKYEQQINHLVNPPACTACPFYTKVRGTHYCGMKICHSRKTVAWERHIIDQNSKNLKIPIYNKDEDGGYVLLVGYENSHKKVFMNRHAGLRLLPRSAADRYASQWGFEGVSDDHVLVVATGQAMDKLDTTSWNRSKGGKKTEKEKAEMRMMRVYRVRRKEFLWEFTAIAKSIFDGVPVEAIKKLQGWHYVRVDDAIPSEWLKGKKATIQIEADFERRELIWRMIDQVCSYYSRSSMRTILGELTKQAGEWGIKIPVRLTKLAEQFDAEIEAAAAPKAAK